MTDIRRIDETLSARRGHLYMEECSIPELAGKFGTPLFLISEDQIQRNVRTFQKAFSVGWDGPVKVMPAAKANWITAIQRILASEGCGCDIYSAGELAVAMEAGFDPRFVSVNGVPKNAEHVKNSIACGVRITIDSVEEVEMIEAAARELGKTARVRLRLKPPLSGFTDHTDFVAEGFVPTDVAAMVYKGGLVFEHVKRIAPRIMASEHMELMGFHQHHGRHHVSLAYWREQMRAFSEEMGKVSTLLGGYQPKEIDIGGGFAVRRDPFAKAVHFSDPIQLAALHAVSKALAPFGPDLRYKIVGKLMDTVTYQPNRKRAPTIAEYGRTCTAALGAELPKNGIDTNGLMLQLEPGRCLHGNAGIHVARVTNLKPIRSPFPWNLVVTDTTEFWFTGGRYEHHLHDYVFADKTEAPMTGKADIIGRSCYGDRLMGPVAVPDVAVGDILAFLDTGAYQEVSMSNFNALPRPATVLISGDDAQIIRRAETQEDVFRRDFVPERLLRAAKEAS